MWYQAPPLWCGGTVAINLLVDLNKLAGECPSLVCSAAKSCPLYILVLLQYQTTEVATNSRTGVHFPHPESTIWILPEYRFPVILSLLWTSKNRRIDLQSKLFPLTVNLLLVRCSPFNSPAFSHTICLMNFCLIGWAWLARCYLNV